MRPTDARTSQPPPAPGPRQACASFSDAPGPTAAPQPRRGTRWRIFKWTVRLSVLLFIVMYLGCVGLDSFFYHPNQQRYDHPADFGIKYEDVRFQTQDGLTLAGWFLPATAAKPARGTIVHFHGNAANVTGHLLLVSWLPLEGYNVLMFDYRGYGQSEGKPTRGGTITDGNAAIDFALSRPDVRGRPLFAYGQSLGAAVAVVVAADRPEIAAVIAESPFSNYRRIAAQHLQKRIFVTPLAKGLAALSISNGYDPIDAVDRIAPRPLLVIVAENDSICFPELGRELFDAAREPKQFWKAPGAEHLGILDGNSSALMEHVTTFLDHAAATGP